jgi:hypothetical protein
LIPLLEWSGNGDLAVILWRGLLSEEPVPTEGYSMVDVRYSIFGIEEAEKRKTKNAMGDLAVSTWRRSGDLAPARRG